jgi:hypothetical protein
LRVNLAVRFLLPGLALVLSGCSIPDSIFPDPEPVRSDFADTVTQIRKIYPDLKLPGNPEISDVHRNRSASLGDWALCLRNDAIEQRQYYTLFFRNKKITEYRLSVLADGCEAEAFAPLPR